MLAQRHQGLDHLDERLILRIEPMGRDIAGHAVPVEGARQSTDPIGGFEQRDPLAHPREQPTQAQSGDPGAEDGNPFLTTSFTSHNLPEIFLVRGIDGVARL